jgi:hypothetical protein
MAKATHKTNGTAWDITDATDAQLDAILAGNVAPEDVFSALLGDNDNSTPVMGTVEITHYCRQNASCDCIHCTDDYLQSTYDYEGAILASQEDESWGV